MPLAQCLPHVQAALLEVDVDGSQSEQFAASQAGAEVDCHRHVKAPLTAPDVVLLRVAVVGRRRNERRLFGRRVDMEGRRLLLGQADVAQGLRAMSPQPTANSIAAETKIRCLRTVAGARPAFSWSAFQRAPTWGVNLASETRPSAGTTCARRMSELGA